MDALKSLALDLAQVDLARRDDVVRLLVDHAVAPARQVWGLPLPERGERGDDVLGATVLVGRTLVWFRPTPPPAVSTVLFDPLMRGYVLFTRLLPSALVDPDRQAARLDAPGWVYFEDSRALAAFLWDDLERLVDGLLGRPPALGDDPWLGNRYRVERNDVGLAELAEAQALVRRCLATPPPEEPPLRLRHDIGLRALDREAAGELDELLRAEVHQRAVWLAETDLLIPLWASDEDGWEGVEERVEDHGVYATAIPETIRGAVALDLVTTFSRERAVGICAHCSGPVVLTAHQVGRVDHALPVYHPSCSPTHRRRWMRDYQRARRASAAGKAAATHAVD